MSNPINVLIVDDSMTTRFFIEKALRAATDVQTCHHAGNGIEALAVLEVDWVDMVVMDLNMPRMDGRTFLKAVRANDLWREIPIAVVTSDQSESTRGELIGLGANLICRKPLSPQEAVALVAELKGAS